jgi:Domain of unknown function (DUF1906)
MRRAGLLAGALGLLITAPVTVAHAATGTGGSVDYHGVHLPVPAGWPVYHLDTDPTRCVRFDQHAIYLGAAGHNQLCPPHVVGKTEAIQIEPLNDQLDAVVSGILDWMQDSAHGVQLPAAPNGQLSGIAIRDTTSQQIQIIAPKAGVLVTASYGTRPGDVDQLLKSMRAVNGPVVSPEAADQAADQPSGQPTVQPTTVPTTVPTGLVPSTPASPSTSRPAVHPTAHPTTPPKATPPKVNPKASPSIHPTTPPQAEDRVAQRRQWVDGRGFDTCGAPSLRAMKAWRKAFVAANVYIGGAARACPDGNLSAAWVRAVRAMGWRLIPTYVGLQAPCTSFHSKFTPKNAHVQGELSADYAVRRARQLGMGAGAPIYFDLEPYNSKKATCRNAVLRFLDGWSRRLKALHYTSGVYGGATTGIRDLGWARGIMKPSAIWFAHWDRQPNAAVDRLLQNSWWFGHRRIKQHRGDHVEKHGGIKLVIDSDSVDGFVY